jgi:methylthioribose-1-phosphate isomerase
MKVPSIARYADALRYERDLGVIRAIDWRAYPAGQATAEITSVEQAAEAIAASVVGRWVAPYLGGYALALAARAWAGRPSEARRGALIQAGAQLRMAAPADGRLASLVAGALARADAAILGGADAEEAVLAFLASEVARADRAAERCGRLAAGLLDEQDHVLAHGFPGPALAWMLAFARDEGKQPVLHLAGSPGDANGRIVAGLASELQVACAIEEEPAVAAQLANGSLGLFVAGAWQLALDGSALAERGAARWAVLAGDHGVPRYLLGYDGPDPAAPTGDSLAGALDETLEVVAPQLISVIITTRGIYRPEMIARYLHDGDAPLDVIPLQ